MAIFSRLTAVLAISSLVLVVNPVVADTAVGARSLKQPQVRAAARHHNAAGLSKRTSSKRSSTKQQACKAKADQAAAASTSTSSTVAATSTTWAAAATSTTPVASATPASSGSSGSGGSKIGLGWNDGTNANQQQFWAATWCYSWSPWPCSQSSNVENIPMLWGYKQVGDFQSNVGDGSAFSAVLGMNEPDQSGQSAMSVGDAITLWNQQINGLKTRKGSPAVTSSPTGLAWLKSFTSGCSGCTIDFVCLHYYGTTFDDFKSVVTQVYNENGYRPVWITEWACEDFGGQGGQCDLATVQTFLSQTQSWMDSTDWIERYAYFGSLLNMYNVNPTNRLMSAGGQITALGQQYMSG